MRHPRLGRAASSKSTYAVVLPIAVWTLLLVLWQLWVVVRDVPAYLLPSPGRIARTAWQMGPRLPGHITATMTEALAGLVTGAAVGVILALSMVRFAAVRRVLYPLVAISQTIPMIVMAPLLVIWFGFGLTPKVVLVALIVMFPVLVATTDGLDGVDSDLTDLIYSMGGSTRQVLRLAQLPGAVPSFFSGLRIGATYAVGGAVVAEYLGGSVGALGLGRLIQRAQASFDVDVIFVAVSVVGVLTALLFGLISSMELLATPWQEPTRSRRRLRIRPMSSLGARPPFPAIQHHKDPSNAA